MGYEEIFAGLFNPGAYGYEDMAHFIKVCYSYIFLMAI